MNNIEQIGRLFSGHREMSPSINDSSTLEQRLIEAYIESSGKYDLQKQQVMDLVNGINSATSPETLFAIQQKTADYNIEVSLISALTRKATGTVETLLRA